MPSAASRSSSAAVRPAVATATTAISRSAWVCVDRACRWDSSASATGERSISARVIVSASTARADRGGASCASPVGASGTWRTVMA